MWRRFLIFLVLVSPSGLFAQAELPEHVIALSRIKGRMQQSLDHIPNYTCRQTIERARLTKNAVRRMERQSRRGKGSRSEVNLPLESSDRLQVDLALVDGEELYSWPDAESFEEQSLGEMVGFGNLSAGTFAATAHNLFATHAALFTFAGRDDIGGRTLLRFNFRVGLMQSGFVLSDAAGREAEVPYGGSIWADPDSFDLVRIETQAREIPAYLDIVSAVSRIEYQSVDLNGESFLIPRMAHETTGLRSGAENHNRTEFSDCRRFGASSGISFGNENAVEFDQPVRWEEIELPVGVPLAVRLTSKVDSGTSKIGDRVEGVLESDARDGGEVVAPKDAVVLGRIRRLERYRSSAPYYTLGIELSQVRFDGKRARFTGRMTRMLPVPGVSFGGGPGGSDRSTVDGLTSGRRIVRSETETYTDIDLAGVSVMSIQGGEFHIGPGWRMTWETLVAEPANRTRGAGTN